MLLGLLLFLILMFPSLSAATKVFLFISEQFPQISVKPLHFLTAQPKHELLKPTKGIITDLFVPNGTNKKPALIVAMAVRTKEKDRPILYRFSETLARLGYVVMWPRLEALDEKKVTFDNPETFIESFRYLGQRKDVDKKRISFVGFSVGSSVAMLAAEDVGINRNVHSVVFFGGYYNILDYLTSLATSTMIINGQSTTWQPQQGALDHANGILESHGLRLQQFKNGLLSNSEKDKLLQYSPDQKIENFNASIFILHDKSDSYVPYAESIKLRKALEGKVPITYHLANMFEHVQPKKGFSAEQIKEFLNLFGFLYKVFLFL